MSYTYLIVAETHTEVTIKCALIPKVTVNNSLEPVICINMSYTIIVGMCMFEERKKEVLSLFLRSVRESIGLY